MSDTDERAQGAVIAPVLGADERGELERLRQEVAALRATAVPPPRRRIRWASVAAAVLLVLGCMGVPFRGDQFLGQQPGSPTHGVTTAAGTPG
jgi:hypothetical protein